MNNAFEIIWNQIYETFSAEAELIVSRMISSYNKEITKLIASGLSIDEYFEKALGKDYYTDDYYRTIKYNKLVIVNSDKKLEKSSICDEYVKRIAEYYVENQKWKLKQSVYHYLAGIEMVSVEKLYFRKQVNGFEGSWSFVTSSGEKGGYETKTIIAEGPIVKAHFRYISHVSGNVNIDNTLRAKLLKEHKESKPKLVFESKEEKELNKRIEAAESSVKQSKWFLDNDLARINRYKEELINIPNNLDRYRDPKGAEISFKARLKDAEDEYAQAQQRYEKDLKELEEIKSLTIADIKADLELKADKKRIKELKDKLSGHSLRKLSEFDQATFESVKTKLETELNELYKKYPDIKKKEHKARINWLTKEIKYIKSVLIKYDQAPIENRNEIHIKNISEDLKNHEAELEKIS